MSGVTVLKDLVREEGPGAFFKGLTPKVSRVLFTPLHAQFADVRLYRLWSLGLNSCSVIHSLKRLFHSSPTTFEPIALLHEFRLRIDILSFGLLIDVIMHCSPIILLSYVPYSESEKASRSKLS